METITGLTPQQLIVVTTISAGGVTCLPAPWNLLAILLGATIGVALQQYNRRQFHFRRQLHLRMKQP